MGLTKTETAILANAARRETRALLPLPRFIFVRGLSIIIALEKLLRLGLAAERQATGDEPVWRTSRMPMTLAITDAGLAALGGDALPYQPHPAASEATAPAMTEDVRHVVLMSIMSRPQGANVKLIQQETSLPLHSVRTAISGLRAEGYLFDHVRDAHGATTYQLIGWLPGDGGLEYMPVAERLHA